jgi:toxin-antitoxin system PIN domain toxin
MFLPDVNLWLALAFESHVHHTAARSWFETPPDRACSFCRMTQLGFLRLATNPKAFGAEAVALRDAWALYDAFLADPRIAYLDEPAGLEPFWRVYTTRETFSPKVWNDAYLAAFARAAGCDVVTFDGGFAQYQGVSCTILS